MERWYEELNPLYDFIMSGAVDDFDKIVRLMFFLIIFRGLLFIMMELMKIGKGYR